MVRFFIDLLLLFGNHSEISIQLKVGFMLIRRQNFVGTKLGPLIQEKSKPTDNISSDKREYGKMESPLQNTSLQN